MRYSPSKQLGRAARLILHIEMPLMLLSAVIFLVSYLCCRDSAPAYAVLHYPPLVVYLFEPMIITAFSVLLAERMETDR